MQQSAVTQAHTARVNGGEPDTTGLWEPNDPLHGVEGTYEFNILYVQCYYYGLIIKNGRIW